MNQHSRTEASSVPVQHQEGSTDCGLFSIAYPYYMLASVDDCLEQMVFDQGMIGSHLFHCFRSQKLTVFLQLSAPARHGKTWHHLFLSIVCVGCQCFLIYTWCIASYASLGFTLSVWDSCHLHGPDNWACTQCELRS